VKKIFIVLLLAFTVLSVVKTSHSAEKLTKSSNDMKAVLTFDADTSLIDVYLSDAKTAQAIKDAQLKALVKTPSGKRITVELPGMMMGQTWSYMNNVEMTEAGKYSISLTAHRKGGKKAKFKFTVKVNR